MATVIQQFLKQAEKQPDHVAVLDSQGAITYDRMNNLSAYMAEQILDRIGGKDRRGRIALLLPRTKAFVVAQFAVLRAGCAVVPIDAEYPAERVQAILEESDELMSVCAYLDGQYGVKDLFINAPVRLGKNGVEEIVEFDLEPEELAAYQASAESVRAGLVGLPE